eukprot:946196-Amphidinium_carterae.1
MLPLLVDVLDDVADVFATCVVDVDVDVEVELLGVANDRLVLAVLMEVDDALVDVDVVELVVLGSDVPELVDADFVGSVDVLDVELVVLDV